MGMFDNVICEVPLPDGLTPNTSDLQTKDLENVLGTCKIGADGRLYWRDVDSVWEEGDPLPPLPADRTKHTLVDVLRSLGRFREVPGSESWRDLHFHGWFEFGCAVPTQEYYQVDVPGRAAPFMNRRYELHDYRAKFTDGQLQHIEVVPPPEKRK